MSLPLPFASTAIKLGAPGLDFETWDSTKVMSSRAKSRDLRLFLLLPFARTTTKLCAPSMAHQYRAMGGIAFPLNFESF